MTLYNVPYAGLVTLKLRTYTTTYPYFRGGWNFPVNSMHPMEFNGRTLNQAPIGCNGSLFDVNTGITSFRYGNQVSGGFSGDFGGAVFDNNRLAGFSFGYPNKLQCAIFNRGITLGNSVIDPTFNLGVGFSVLGGGMPASYAGSNFKTALGIYTSYLNGGTKEFACFDNQTNLIVNNLVMPGTYNASHGIYAIIPVNGVDYVWCTINSLLPGPRLTITTLPNRGVDYTPNLINPPGDFDANAYINTDTPSPSITYQGWAWVFKTTQTIDGETCVGGMILVAPNWSSYKIVRFIPVDSNAASWYNPIGTVYGKFDLNGALWLKNFNNSSTLFVTAGSIVRMLPIFPPVALPPPPPDMEIPIKPFRESGAKS
jgi:hypothetical protein